MALNQAQGWQKMTILIQRIAEYVVPSSFTLFAPQRRSIHLHQNPRGQRPYSSRADLLAAHQVWRATPCSWTTSGDVSKLSIQCSFKSTSPKIRTNWFTLSNTSTCQRYCSSGKQQGAGGLRYLWTAPFVSLQAWAPWIPESSNAAAKNLVYPMPGHGC